MTRGAAVGVALVFAGCWTATTSATGPSTARSTSKAAVSKPNAQADPPPFSGWEPEIGAGFVAEQTFGWYLPRTIESVKPEFCNGREIAGAQFPLEDRLVVFVVGRTSELDSAIRRIWRGLAVGQVQTDGIWGHEGFDRHGFLVQRTATRANAISPDVAPESGAAIELAPSVWLSIVVKGATDPDEALHYLDAIDLRALSVFAWSR